MAKTKPNTVRSAEEKLANATPVGDTGFYESTLENWLDLSAAQMQLIDMKIDLSVLLKRLRIERGLSQAKAAGLIGSDQARFQKAENGHSSTGFDYYVKALAAVGANRVQIAQAFAGIDLPASDVSTPTKPIDASEKPVSTQKKKTRKLVAA